MNEHSPNHCQECEADLFQLDGEYYCPACDSISGFELVPDREQFTL